MYFKITYDQDFDDLWMHLKSKYPKKLFDVDGVGGQLDMSSFSRDFFTNNVTADSSVDANANVDDNSVIAYVNEMPKPFFRMNSYYVLWKELKRLYGRLEANKVIEMQLAGDIYINDFHGISSKRPYSYHKNTPLIIKINENIKFITMEDLWKYINDNSNIREDEYNISDRNIKILDNGEFVNVSRVLRHKSHCDLVELETKDGYCTIVTEDHPVITDIEEKRANTLTLKDTLKHDNISIDVEEDIDISPKFAYILGFALGDGRFELYSNTNNEVTSVGLMIYQSDFKHSQIYKLCKEEFNYINQSTPNRFYCSGHPKIKNYSYLQKVVTDKSVPHDILHWSIESQKAFIAGIIDSEGCVNKGTGIVDIRMTSYGLIQQIATLSRKLNIGNCRTSLCGSYNSEISYNSNHRLYRISYRLTDKDMIYLSSKVSENEDIIYRTMQKDGRWNTNKLNKINTIPYIGQYVYDITTETGTFQCNGLSQHNCFNYSTYDVMINGLPFINKIKSVPPKYLYSFKSQLEQFIVYAANSTLGACMYKDQNIIIRENGIVKSVTAKEFVEGHNPHIEYVKDNKVWKTNIINDVEVYENGKFIPIKKVFKSPYAEEIYKIKTKTGKQAKVNKKHIFKVLRNDKLEEVEAQNLKLYDTVINTTGGNFPIEKENQDYKDGQFIGILCGDGHISHKDGMNISLGCGKEEIIMDWLDNYLQKKGYRYFIEKENYWRYSIFDKELQNKILTEEIINLHSYDKYPKDILDKSLEFQIGFVDGLLATDGSLSSGTIDISLTNKKLIDIISRVLQNVFVYKTNRKEYNDERENRKKIHRISFSKKLKDNFVLFNEIKGNYTNTCMKETSYFGRQSHKKKATNKFEPIGRCSNSWKEKHRDKIYDVITEIKTFDNDDDYVYEIETKTHWYSCGGILTHNTGTADLLIVMSYYVKNLLDKKEDAGITFKTKKDCWNYVRENLVSFIYTVNQPNRSGLQSAFTNVSIYDDGFLDDMLGDFVFPDGSSPDKNVVKDLQDLFLTILNDEMRRTPITFPVITACFAVDKNNNILDKEFAKFIAEKNQEFGYINIFCGESSTLSSCCRLRSDKTNEYFNSFGAGSSKIGSQGVCTINLPRLAIKYKYDEDKFFEKLKDMVKVASMVNNARRKLLEGAIENGNHPLYTLDFIDLERQYSTVGINGFNECITELGYNILTEDGQAVALDIINIINEENDKYEKQYGAPHNCEQVPGENLSVKLPEKDSILKYQEKYDLYSNQFIPLTTNADMLDRIELQGKFDKHFTGGAVCHINVEDKLSVDKQKELIEHCAKKGVVYWAVNYNLQECENGHLAIGKEDKCKVCDAKITNNYTRVVGFLTNTKNWHKTRRDEDYPNRQWYGNII
jgi:ribonucleoside-triphosphate reductase (formate)